MKSIHKILTDRMVNNKSPLKYLDIPGYRGLYQMNNRGEVFNIKERMLNPSGGSVVLTDLRKIRYTLRIHKLISLCFDKKLQFKSDEAWSVLPIKELNHYSISNYGNIIVNRTFKMRTMNGQIVINKNGKPKTFSILKLWVNLFMI